MSDKSRYLRWLSLLCLLMALFCISVFIIGYKTFSVGRVATTVALLAGIRGTAGALPAHGFRPAGLGANVARISDADIARVREATDLVAVVQDVAPLKPKGRDLWCCCPFHQEKTPSMKVDPSTQLWHCFGCGEGGDVFGFVMKSEDLSFPEAVRLLADRAHIDIVEEEGRGPRTTQNQKLRLKEVCRETAEFYHGQLMRNPAPEAADARNYLAGRGFKTPVAKRWMLGFAPGRGALVRHLTSKGFSGEEMTLANVGAARPRRPFAGPLLQPHNVPHLRRVGRLHRLRRARGGQGRAQVPELPGNPAVPQIEGALRPGQGEGLHGRPAASPSWWRATPT